MTYKENLTVIVYIITFPDIEFTEHTSNSDLICVRIKYRAVVEYEFH